jgi:hypothetical protein
MKRFMAVLAAMAIIGLTSTALAGSEEPARTAKPATLTGWIVSVNTTIREVVVFKGGPIIAGVPSNVTVHTNGSTKITIDGKAVKLADLKVWMYVVVTPATGTAKSIAGQSAPRAMPL